MVWFRRFIALTFPVCVVFWFVLNFYSAGTASSPCSFLWVIYLILIFNIKIGSNSYEKVETFKFLGSLLTNKNYIQEEIKCWLKAGDSCYYSSKHSCLLDFFLRINLPLFSDFFLRINLPLFSTVVPAIIFIFLSCRPFVAITTLSFYIF